MQKQYFKFNNKTGYFIESIILDESPFERITYTDDGMQHTEIIKPKGITDIQPPHARGSICDLRFDSEAQVWIDEGITPVHEPTTEEIITTLEREILRGMPTVVAHLYDIVNASVLSISSSAYSNFEAQFLSSTTALSDDERLLVQIEREPNSTGRSKWREMVETLEALKNAIQ